MAVVISLDEYRQRRRPDLAAVQRLDDAVGRLDGLVRAHEGRLTPTIERELAAIGRALSSGRREAAAERAERLIGLLQHPAASGS